MPVQHVGTKGDHLPGPVGAVWARVRLLSGVGHVVATEVLLVVELLATDRAGEVHARVGGGDAGKLIERKDIDVGGGLRSSGLL